MSMTSNTANISVCNQSLGMLGADEITVAGTTDQNHIYCTTFFDDARDEILLAHRWNFAKKRAYALEATTPIFGWDNAFTKPTDVIKVWAIEESPDAEWEVEASLILTNEGSAAKLISELVACRQHFESLCQTTPLSRLIFLSSESTLSQVYYDIAQEMKIPAQIGNVLQAVDVQLIRPYPRCGESEINQLFAN